MRGSSRSPTSSPPARPATSRASTGSLSPLGLALTGLPEIAVNGPDAGRIGRGQSVLIRGRDAPVAAPVVQATHGGDTIALGEIAAGAFHPKRVFRA